jgi:broad specificity phosphatase PhoE
MDAETPDTGILLIRHGETPETAAQRYPSGVDVPLTERGRAQAGALARATQRIAFDAMFCSNTRRAHETAICLMADRDLELNVLPELAEMGFGRLGGLTFDEAMAAFPDLFNRWHDNPFDVMLPNSEPFLDFVGRVRRVRRHLTRQWSGRTIAVVTHGGVIAVWRCLEEGRPWDDFWRSIPAPGTGVWLIRAEGQVRVETLRPEV